ncbi:hypothetical protein MMC25_006900 [Agyrium rufum]|nr:hypothetical protein [Agyrium rufum]
MTTIFAALSSTTLLNAVTEFGIPRSAPALLGARSPGWTRAIRLAPECQYCKVIKKEEDLATRILKLFDIEDYLHSTDGRVAAEQLSVAEQLTDWIEDEWFAVRREYPDALMWQQYHDDALDFLDTIRNRKQQMSMLTKYLAAMKDAIELEAMVMSTALSMYPRLRPMLEELERRTLAYWAAHDLTENSRDGRTWTRQMTEIAHCRTEIETLPPNDMSPKTTNQVHRVFQSLSRIRSAYHSRLQQLHALIPGSTTLIWAGCTEDQTTAYIEQHYPNPEDRPQLSAPQEEALRDDVETDVNKD